MKRKSDLWLRQEPTEETVFAEYQELLLQYSNLRNFSVKDAVNLAKGFFGEAVRRELRRSKLEDSTLGKHGRQRTQEAEQRKRHAQVIAARLLRDQKVLRLPRKKSELALRVHKELAKKYDGKPPASRTVRRWIDELTPPKK